MATTVSQMFFEAYEKAVQGAEEIGGPEVDDYIDLMERISRDAAERAINARAWIDNRYPVGTRVRARSDVDRYPEFLIPEGCVGDVIFDIENQSIAVKVLGLDMEGLQAWNNNVLYVGGEGDRMREEWEAL